MPGLDSLLPALDAQPLFASFPLAAGEAHPAPSAWAIFWRILATLGLVTLNGYFVASEFAAVGARASRLEHETTLSARLSLAVKRRLDLYLSTCQLGITIASLGLGYVTEPAVVSLIEPPLEAWGIGINAHAVAVAIGLSISTILHVVVGEVAPKNLAIFFPDRLLPILAGPLIAFTFLFYPVIWVLNAASNGLLRLVGVEVQHEAHSGPAHSVTELRSLLAQAVATGTIAPWQAELLTGAFEFGDLKVRQIMTPRVDVDYLLLDQPMNEILRLVQESEFTRLPLCDKDLDHVVGLIHMKDLFAQLHLTTGKLKFADEKTPEGESVAVAGAPGSAMHVLGSGTVDLSQIKREILFVPELLPVNRLLLQFQESKVHMAVVVDEYGSTEGVVTLEDVIEQIVGDITDEFDTATARFTEEGENFRVTGTFPLHELKDRLKLGNLDLGHEDIDTIGGWVTAELGRWPRAGDSTKLGDYLVRVVQVTQDRQMQLLIAPVTQTAARADGPGKA